MVAITFDGVEYANVRLDPVRSSGRLFPKFGRNTLLSCATRLAKKMGREFISYAAKCRPSIFCVLSGYRAGLFQTPTAASEGT